MRYLSMLLKSSWYFFNEERLLSYAEKGNTFRIQKKGQQLAEPSKRSKGQWLLERLLSYAEKGNGKHFPHTKKGKG